MNLTYEMKVGSIQDFDELNNFAFRKVHIIIVGFVSRLHNNSYASRLCSIISVTVCFVTKTINKIVLIFYKFVNFVELFEKITSMKETCHHAPTSIYPCLALSSSSTRYTLCVCVCILQGHGHCLIS